ncbi:signal transduction histidine kinase/FixJ family two-component response regulator [Arthrobacter pigmenti]|uniref:histidine kinase n=1 Tax=Arthrobacter pigmenti TaxID=271432 RepID=A0A846RSZ2_9MICC|nr:signal transduction histidine kinase/FixJ family two-component response regulator [Arthrobacter pigmenti]
MGEIGEFTGAGTVLAVDSDVVVLGQVADALRAAGYAVIAHSDVAPGMEAAHQGKADVAVVGASVALEYLGTIAKEADHLLPRNIPVVLTAATAGQVTSHPELAMRSSDYVLLPLDPDELVHRVVTAVHRNGLREERRNESAFLRERIRRISDAIRHTNSPSEMIDLSLAGIGEALSADEVMLHIFDDRRISCDSGAWRSGEGAVTPAGVGELIDELRELGTDLWRTSGSVAVIDGESEDVPARLHLLRAASADFTQSGLLLPIGEGSSAFGVLWIVADRGRRKWSSAEISLLTHLLGNLAHGVIQGQLILGQQQVLDRLHELDSAKDAFVATVHHELRTPLSSILGYVELLQDGDGGDLPPSALKMLKIIERNGQRLGSLVENVLALSVLDAGTELAPAPVDLVDLVESIVTDLLPLASAKGVSVSLAPTDSKQLVSGVRELLERAFVNVLSNAVKFTPDGGSVTIRFRPDNNDDGAVRVEFEDTGMGIPADELPQLLTRFYRASNSVAAEIPGTGLGLSIAAQAVERHGGTLGVQSQLGKGTTVTIELPRS